MPLLKAVPVDPALKSRRNWINAAYGLVAGNMAVPEIVHALAAQPFDKSILIGGVAAFLMGGLNVFLTSRSKAGVVSKNILVSDDGS